MAEETTALQEVLLSSERTQFVTKVLGNKTTSKFIYAAFTTNRLGNEIGFIVRKLKCPMILKNLIFLSLKMTFFPLRFRLNFYNFNYGFPRETLLK